MPQFIDKTLAPQYWSELNFRCESKIFSVEDLFKLVKYVNIQFKKLNINLSSFENLDFNKLFSMIPNLKSLLVKLDYPTIISDICYYFKHVTEIGIVWNGLTNEHLMLLVDNFPYLSIISISTTEDVNSGVLYLVRNLTIIKEI